MAFQKPRRGTVHVLSCTEDPTTAIELSAPATPGPLVKAELLAVFGDARQAEIV